MSLEEARPHKIVQDSDYIMLILAVQLDLTLFMPYEGKALDGAQGIDHVKMMQCVQLDLVFDVKSSVEARPG